MSLPSKLIPIPEGCILATDIAVGDYITFYRREYDAANKKWKDLWRIISGHVENIVGETVYIIGPHGCFRPNRKTILFGRPFRKLWENEDEREPELSIKPPRPYRWDPNNMSDPVAQALAADEAYEGRRKALGVDD